METNNDCAILVNSCDSYCDLWKSFFSLLKNNWPEMTNYSIYLNTESTKLIDVGCDVRCITTKCEETDLWGKRLIHSLSEIQENYVIVLMDDFFLREKISQERIVECLERIKRDQSIAVFYMVNIPGKDYDDCSYKGFVEIPKGDMYRLNSAPGIWNKEKLVKYIKETDNPWAWECFGSCRTDKQDDRFFCINSKNKPIYDYAHAIYRGKWLEKEIKPLLESFDLDIDVSVRGSVKEGDVLPKRSLLWKVNFILTGVQMVGLDAIKVIIKGMRNANKSK